MSLSIKQYCRISSVLGYIEEKDRNSNKSRIRHDDVVIYNTETHALRHRSNHYQQNQYLRHPTQSIATRAPQQSPIDGHQTPIPVTEQPATSSDREQLSQEVVFGVRKSICTALFHGNPAGQYVYSSPFRYMYYTHLNTGHQIIVEQPIQAGLPLIHHQQPNTADVTEIIIETEQQAPSTSVNITNDTKSKTGTDSQTSHSSKTTSTIKLSSYDSKIAAQKQTSITGQNKRITAKELNKKYILRPKRKPVTKK